MNAKTIRAKLTDEDLEELTMLASKGEDLSPRLVEIIGHIAEGYGEEWQNVIGIAPHASKIAEALIASASRHKKEIENLHGEGFLKFENAVSGSATSASQSLAEVDSLELFLNPVFANGLTRKQSPKAESQYIMDGEIIARALSMALAESLYSDEMESRDVLRRLQSLMSDVSVVVEDEWRKHLDRHLSHVVKRGNLIGLSVSASRAAVCAEGMCRTGKAKQGESPSQLIFALGVSALDIISDEQLSHQSLPKEVRLGALAMAATDGFSVGWQSYTQEDFTLEPVSPLQEFDRYDSAHELYFIADGIFNLRFKWGELESLALLTVDAACDRLEQVALSPRVSAGKSKRYSLLASSARGASRHKDEHTSFARTLGIRETVPKENVLLDGMRLYPAAPVGRRPATLIMRGRANRPMRLCAAANGEGHLVGYMGHDPLSEEFHGNPEKYVYDLDGWRQGRMVDGIYRKGQPRVKMMTAPEGVDLSPIKKPAY